MNLLIFPQYPFPTNHAVVNTVYEGLLPSRGHTVHMVRPMRGIEAPRLVETPWGNGRMAVYPHEAAGTSRVRNVVQGTRRSRWVAQAIRLFDDVALDAVLVRNDLLSASAGLKLARRRGIPFVFQISSPDAEFMMTHGREIGGLAGLYARVRGRYGLAVRRWVSRRADAVLAISDAMRQQMVDVDRVEAPRVFAFPMGTIEDDTSPAEVERVRRELNLPPGRTVVYTGTIHPVRQPEWMLDVFDRVRRQVADAVLLVVTYDTGPIREEFEAKVRDRQADVRVVGPIAARDVPTYLRCADVLLAAYPPRPEHRVVSPTKSIEALGAGLAVVGSAEVDEHVSVLEASGGGICVAWDRDRFADALVTLLRDPAMRRRMGESGRAWVRAHRTYTHLTAYLERILSAATALPALAGLDHLP